MTFRHYDLSDSGLILFSMFGFCLVNSEGFVIWDCKRLQEIARDCKRLQEIASEGFIMSSSAMDVELGQRGSRKNTSWVCRKV